MWCTSLLNHLKEEEKIPAFPVYQHKAWPHHVSGTWQSPAPIHIFQCIQSQNLNNCLAKAFFLQRHQIKSKFSGTSCKSAFPEMLTLLWSMPCPQGRGSLQLLFIFPQAQPNIQTRKAETHYSWKSTIFLKKKKTWTFKSLEYLAARKFMSFSSDCLELFICTMFHYQLW